MKAMRGAVTACAGTVGRDAEVRRIEREVVERGLELIVRQRRR